MLCLQQFVLFIVDKGYCWVFYIQVFWDVDVNSVVFLFCQYIKEIVFVVQQVKGGFIEVNVIVYQGYYVVGQGEYQYYFGGCQQEVNL